MYGQVQYPGALNTMIQDIKNLRILGYFLSKTDLKFDLVSVIDELDKQIKLEFDFRREARIMDSIADHLDHVKGRIQVPRSVPGLASNKLLVMSFLEGIPLTEAGKYVGNMSKVKREAAKRLILRRVSEAYGLMILREGLFQADGHPGNILVGKGGRIGLLDYGQSKQIPDLERRGFAQLLLALNEGIDGRISQCLGDLGIVTSSKDASLRAMMARGMFDTSGRVDPFDPESPIKKSAISKFPSDLFFVLRVVQLLRGLAAGMGINDFSSAKQWKPYARAALKNKSGYNSSFRRDQLQEKDNQLWQSDLALLGLRGLKVRDRFCVEEDMLYLRSF